MCLNNGNGSASSRHSKCILGKWSDVGCGVLSKNTMMHAIISYLIWKYIEFFWTEFWIIGWFNKLNELTKNVEGKFPGIIEGGDQQNHESIQNEWKCCKRR